MASARSLGASAIAIVAVAVALAWWSRAPKPHPCAVGFTRLGARCCPGDVDVSSTPEGGACPPPRGACPSPLVAAGGACVAPDVAVTLPAAEVMIGPSDWEAEGRVPARRVRAGPVRLDALEASVGRVACPTCPLPGHPSLRGGDPSRAASSITLAEARRFCAARGGRLPSEDEWIVAAAASPTGPRRYPWGDTGAVCRRVAFGLTNGPCAWGATGPDTVGARPEGRTASGLYDMAGNVAEWVEGDAPSGAGVVRGGSYATALAADLRTWARRVVPAGERDPSIGVRCAFDVAVR